MRLDSLRSALWAGALALAIAPAHAAFVSGSTGADGALNIATNTTLPVQADGVHNYTTITIASGATLTFTNNATNTPVVLLATGDVTINGAIDLNGQAGRNYFDPLATAPGSEARPGPGGFPGGLGGIPVFNLGDGLGTPGGGPGGGASSTDLSTTGSGRGRAGNAGSHFTAGGVGAGNANAAAPTYGDPRLITLSGGSGGAGGNCVIVTPISYNGPAGGAGGGAILIASSTSIVLNGYITANGGSANGAADFAGGGTEGAGAGSGGTVRLMANSISGTGYIRAIGGTGAASGGRGAIRLEGFSVAGPTNFDPPPSITTPTVVSLAPADQPTIQITSIAGQAVPNPPTGSTATADVTIPPGTPNPISVVVQTTNMPTGTTISLRITQENGQIVTGSGTTNGSGQATVTVSLSTGFGVVYATADFP